MLTNYPIIALDPLNRPGARVAAAACRAGALGVLDLGDDRARARTELERMRRARVGLFAVRVMPEIGPEWLPLPDDVAAVIVPAGGALEPWRGRPVIAEVLSPAEVGAAEAAGAVGIIARGSEAGGRVGEQGAFVLAQSVLAVATVPVWVQGGIGPHTAAACIAGGAAGVVLDSQLALTRESELPPAVQEAIGGMDGSETVVLGGHRVFTRPDLPVAGLSDLDEADVRSRIGADDLHAQLLPVGQDGAFARPLARRFKTVGGVITAVLEAMGAHLRTARRVQPLRPGSSFGEAHGTRYPIVQGPMTRVSDQAEFADAVARAGGLPFLALSLNRGDKVRALLAETAALLGDRPWGVGILGFVPPSLRDEQLAALREHPPAVALIAGGRPSQARALEAEGTETFLHVPSPGLLDLFLNDGARRFVFEGRECGGHVGPRSSFALWEAQIDRLLALPDDLSDVHVLFAGGIHDARSGAMVSAMAAPLADRGAHIGVVMGTAYLFTEEAVATGAILPGFQAAAMDCEHTVLLETAPGHSTRCAETEYVDAFRREKARLEAEGLGAKDVWAELEQLNLGRLRMASKGLRRVGSALETIDEGTQAREGMFMIGQVATMRHATCTMAELHADVSAGSVEVLRAARAPVDPRHQSARPPADIAIIGVASVFPGAPDAQTFWSNVVAGRDALREVPDERWSADVYFDPESRDGTKTPSKWGGFLDPIPFDPLEYGIPPRSLAAIEPVQLLALEMAKRALEDAGYAEREFPRERTSVVFGAEAGTDLAGGYGFRNLFPQLCGELPEALDEVLPSLTEDSFPGVLANVIAGRIANRLDLGGSNHTVDAACASSLAAVDHAVSELVNGTAEMVLCGGADLHNSINDYLMFSSVHALSRKGRCATFDAEADGIALGEGVAVMVLKRLADAERDGDRIYAVIKGVGASSDGRSLGLTAPRQKGQVRALERAYAHAGVDLKEVGLVEAHGTGTVVGDRTELATLTQVFTEAGVGPGAVSLGSVKSNIGHTKCAAGMAGLIKSAFALHHRVLPPTLHIASPNPAWDSGQSPFVFHQKARPWTGQARNAGVSAFGFGGTNYHVVLAEHASVFDRPEAGHADWPAELFLFRAATPAAAALRVQALTALLESEGEPWAQRRLSDLACTVCSESMSEPARIAVVARDRDELQARLQIAAKLTADPRQGVYVADSAATSGKIAFLFPGQGSQRPGMLADLFVAFPELGRHLESGERWLDRMFPPAAFDKATRDAQRAAITDTRVAQPTLGMADLAMRDVLDRLGVRSDMMGGHSYGELVALAVAGALDPAELFELSAARGECILAASGDDPGTMAAVSAPIEAVREAIEGIDGVVVANHNAPKQAVISGPTGSVDAAVQQLAGAGLSARKIPVACAFHSGVVAGASDTFRARLDQARVSDRLAIPVWSNTTAEPYPDGADTVRAMLAAHVARPVRFVEQIESMYAAGARVFVEAGPGRVLTGLVGRILQDRPHVAVACDRGRGSSLESLLHAVAQLAVLGTDVQTDALFAGRGARAFDLSAPPPVGPRQSSWLVNGQIARPIVGELPSHALKPVVGRVLAGLPSATGDAPTAVERDTVMLDYLSTMRQLVESQREIMLGYLGRFPAGAHPPSPRVLDAVTAGVTGPEAAEEVAGEPEAEPASATAEVVDIGAALLGIVSERTGYPIEMLGLDLDLEADLSIDSIKRIEILGALGERMGLGADDGGARDELIEQLASIKSLREIIAWLEARRAAPVEEDAPAVEEPAASNQPAAVAAPETIGRYTLALKDAPSVAHAEVTAVGGRRFVIAEADQDELARDLASLLTGGGAEVRIVAPGADLGELDALIYLATLGRNGRDPVKPLFELTRQAVARGATSVLAATGLGGRFGRADASRGWLHSGGASGLLKTVAKEHPELRVRIVDLDCGEPVGVLSAQLFTELTAGDDLLEVGYHDGVRRTLAVTPSPAKAPNGSSKRIDRDAVVLITGGARGITAGVAIALAERFQCRLELVGRSPLPRAQTDREIAAAADSAALRKLFLARGKLETPKAIESAVRREMGARQIRATLAAVEASGARVRYHSLDVRDGVAFGGLIDSLYTQYGRLDGVIHGAGVLEDKLIKHKTPESFARVYDTKVASARVLAERVRDDVSFVVFFSSVSGAFGNRGQVDYAAANDTLDKIAHAMNARLDGRVLSINWGPWGGEGMVTPELEREYARRGIGLIAPAGGVAAFVEELCDGHRSDAQVIFMRAEPASLQ